MAFEVVSLPVGKLHLKLGQSWPLKHLAPGWDTRQTPI